MMGAMPRRSHRKVILERLDGSVAAIDSLRAQVDDLQTLCGAIIDRLEGGGTLYTAGNGGSAAHAMHLAEELVGRYRGNRKPVAALCLNADPTAMSCIANDFGYEHVFARPCEALLRGDDVLLVLSTSGNSPNIAAALEVARKRGALTVGLLGGDGGRCRALCDHAVCVAGNDSAHAQEAHQVIIHLICELLEE